MYRRNRPYEEYEGGLAKELKRRINTRQERLLPGAKTNILNKRARGRTTRGTFFCIETATAEMKELETNVEQGGLVRDLTVKVDKQLSDA